MGGGSKDLRAAGKFELLVRSNVIAIVTATAERIETANDAFLDLVGYTREELERGLISWRAITPREYDYADDRGLAELLERGECTPFKKEYFHKNGSRVPILIGAVTIARNPLEWACFILDRTAEQCVEAELRRVNQNLALTVESEVAARLKAEQVLSQTQKMDAIGQLTGGIAHDFNNLLQIIVGSLEMLQLRIAESPHGLPSREIERAVQQALDGARRGAALTYKLLAFSRQQPLAPEPVDVNSLVAEMIELIRRTLGERVTIETRLADELWSVMVDPNQLENALLNLAVNARDAMPSGGTLTVETANAERADGTAGGSVMIRVADTGVGMPADIAERAFDPFFTTKGIGEGTGLGLSQVYGFIKQSGGSITLDSAPGAGTRVTICLPRSTVAAAQPAPRRAAHPTSAPAGAGLILVVEDDGDVRAGAVRMLRQLGYDVLEAGDGEAALGVLDRRPDIELMFTDIGLPGAWNGRELAAEARRRRPGLRVLLTTGYARSAVMASGQSDPPVELLRKPYSHAALAQAVRRILAE